MALYRTRLSLEDYIRLPVAKSSTGPMCHTCLRVIPYEEIVEQGSTFVKVLARCHGEEQLETFDFGSVEWDYEMLRSYRMRQKWFDPELIANQGVEVVPGKVGTEPGGNAA